MAQQKRTQSTLFDKTKLTNTTEFVESNYDTSSVVIRLAGAEISEPRVPNFQQISESQTSFNRRSLWEGKEMRTSGISQTGPYITTENSPASKPSQVPVTYLKIEASTYLICNNKLRCFLESQLNAAKLLFHKEGLKMKFFKTAVAQLKTELPNDKFPLTLKFEKHKIRVTASDEKTFRDFLIESDRKVFIRGLTDQTSDIYLRKYLEFFGQVQYLQITPNRLKPNNQCAVAIFASHQSMLAVLECKIHYINGKRVEVDRYINNTFKKLHDSSSKPEALVHSASSANPNCGSRTKNSGKASTSDLTNPNKQQTSVVHASRKLVNMAAVVAASNDGNYRFNICNPKRTSSS
jgi:hypothetical protein